MKYAFLALVVALIGFGLYHANDPVDQTEAVKAASNAYKLEPALLTSVLDVEPRFGIRLDTPQATAQHLRGLLETNNFDLIAALLAYNSNRAFVASIVKEFNSKVVQTHCISRAQSLVDEANKEINAVQGCGFLDAPLGNKACPQRVLLEEWRNAAQTELNACAVLSK